jgi:hypothetical protein
MSKRLVALSAAYGAGGRWIGTAVVDFDDPALYHLALDSTSMPLEACVDLIELAAGAVQ